MLQFIYCVQKENLGSVYQSPPNLIKRDADSIFKAFLKPVQSQMVVVLKGKM